jgi:hypothetical protein
MEAAGALNVVVPQSASDEYTPRGAAYSLHWTALVPSFVTWTRCSLRRVSLVCGPAGGSSCRNSA